MRKSYIIILCLALAGFFLNLFLSRPKIGPDEKKAQQKFYAFVSSAENHYRKNGYFPKDLKTLLEGMSTPPVSIPQCNSVDNSCITRIEGNTAVIYLDPTGALFSMRMTCEKCPENRRHYRYTFIGGAPL